MRARWALVAAAAMLGCGSRDNDKAGQPLSPAAVSPEVGAPVAESDTKESHMFEVKSSADLLALQSEYQRLWDAGFDGTLEVSIAAAAYEAQSWALAPAADSPRLGAATTIDVVLRGGPAALPPPSRVRARKLHLENLLLSSQDSPWQLQVSQSFTMKSSLMIDARARKWDGGPFMDILGQGEEGSGKASPVSARIESSWFVRNWQDESPASMVGFATVETAPSYWDSIAIDDCAFIGNAFAVSLDIRFAKTVNITRSLFYHSWAAGVLIKSTSSGDIVVDDSVVIVESVDQVAAPSAKSPPIKLGKGSRVYVKGWTAGTALPPALVAEADQIDDRGALGAGEAMFAAAAQLPANALPPADLKADLDAAARP